MKRFFTFLKTELKLSVRDMNMPIFAVIMPLVIFVILGVICGGDPPLTARRTPFWSSRSEPSERWPSAPGDCAASLAALAVTAVCSGLAVRFFRWE